MVVEQAEIYDIVRRAVTDAIKQERMNLYFSMLPEVSETEMLDIITEIGVPTSENVDDYVDITEFLANEN